MRWSTSVLLVSAALLAGSLRAQAISDTELRAAYCLGVATQHEEGTRKQVETDPSNRDVLSYSLSIIIERRDKFKAYLAAKGLLGAPGRDSAAISSAIARGPSDVMACNNELQSPPYSTCAYQCRNPQRSTASTVACLADCPSPDACQRAKKCLDNFLP
jgi:hypothetical protein